MDKNIDRQFRSFIRQGLCLVAALFLIGLLVMRVWYLNEMLVPLIVSAVFALVVYVVYGLVWRRVALKSPEQLPTFFTAASGFRLLLTLAVMFVYYLASESGQTLTFFLVLASFYAVMLAHQSIYFARLSNRSDHP